MFRTHRPESSCDTLSIELEALVVKIYKYVHIYTFRVSELQRFCDEADTAYETVLCLESLVFYRYLWKWGE
jgi:CMP-2-keto-3-deoxyoctulosonic acid synthetase